MIERDKDLMPTPAARHTTWTELGKAYHPNRGRPGRCLEGREAWDAWASGGDKGDARDWPFRVNCNSSRNMQLVSLSTKTCKRSISWKWTERPRQLEHRITFRHPVASFVNICPNRRIRREIVQGGGKEAGKREPGQGSEGAPCPNGTHQRRQSNNI